ncbi:membrane protein [Cypionkella aquatica]|uniref:Membrane protein n=1 Tax=Cypionkella aquatica TaxID=1756042 RepID=A0AA37U355_9RHOB|nr:DUF1275 family protein [Cypionkella aquatica]GLS88467.1 membrane protein [Cypionkella aquatica]
MKLTLPPLLSLNGGYVDTIGFLASQGLFTAHVTGNFVTIAATLLHGTSGLAAKLLALPVFCAVVVVTRLLSGLLPRIGLQVLASMLVVKLGLLVLAAMLALIYGPFATADSGVAIVTGMVLVSAMAIQNAIHRIHLANAPPTTLMTGTTTQIMIDIADLLHGAVGEARGTAKARLGRMAVSVFAFALGCGLAALAYIALGNWAFSVPPVLALVVLGLHARVAE